MSTNIDERALRIAFAAGWEAGLVEDAGKHLFREEGHLDRMKNHDWESYRDEIIEAIRVRDHDKDPRTIDTTRADPIGRQATKGDADAKP